MKTVTFRFFYSGGFLSFSPAFLAGFIWSTYRSLECLLYPHRVFPSWFIPALVTSIFSSVSCNQRSGQDSPSHLSGNPFLPPPPLFFPPPHFIFGYSMSPPCSSPCPFTGLPSPVLRTPKFRILSLTLFFLTLLFFCHRKLPLVGLIFFPLRSCLFQRHPHSRVFFPFTAFRIFFLKASLHLTSAPFPFDHVFPPLF